ncbi:MAG: TolC family protein [Nitrospinae bacterium]|nr:TolC family protein [Nitrospinota bacterium]
MRWITRQTLVAVWSGLMLLGGLGCAPWSLVEPPTPYTPVQASREAAEPAQSLAQKAPLPRSAAVEPPPPQTAGELPEMTLETLIRIALEHQPSIRSSEATRAAVSARLGTARAGYFPSIGSTLGYNRATSNIGSTVSATTGNPTQRRVSDDMFNNQNFTAAFSQNVFDSFRREWRVQAAREDFTASNLDLSTTRQNVILNVQQTYYSHLLALRLVQVNQQAVERNIQNLERAKGFFEVGTRPKIDVTRAQVDLANAQLALVQARNQVATTLAALNNAIGVPDFPPYRLKEELEIPPPSGSLEASIRTALDTRTEIRSLQARIRSAQASLTLAKRNFLPSLTADANWSYRGQQFPLAPNWLAGVTLTVPLVAPPLFSQREEAAANLAAAQASEDITRQNILFEVQQSFADLVGALTDAQLVLTQAESQNNQALVNFKVAEARLRKAMGFLQ